MADRSIPDANLRGSLIVVSSADGITPVTLWADPATHALVTGGGTGGGGGDASNATLTGGNVQVQGNIASGATDSGNPVKVGGRFNTTKPTLTDGQRGDLQFDSRGNLIVSIAAASGVTQSSVLAPADAQATQNGLMANVQPAVYNGATYDRQRNATSANGTTGTGLLGTGILAWDGSVYRRVLADTTGAMYSNVVASAVGGYTLNKLISAATTNATVIKASAGTLGWAAASNTNASARWLKVYNKATSPTVGTDVPVATLIIPGNTAGAGTNLAIPSEGLDLSAGISFAITTGVADSDVAAVAANEIVVNYGTK